MRVVLGMIFLASGVLKLVDIHDFSEDVIRYGIIPESVALTISIVIPLSEFVLGGMLLLNYRTGIARLLLIGMVVIFTAVSGIKYMRGGETDCGCFGKVVERKTDTRLFIENAAIVAALLSTKLKTKSSEVKRSERGIENDKAQW